MISNATNMMISNATNMMISNSVPVILDRRNLGNKILKRHGIFRKNKI